ncbi:MAG: PilN domain-containing protein [Actinomycetota bacterium]|nr:PilN domain-containing protein [Actinomycetota bacterium]
MTHTITHGSASAPADEPLLPGERLVPRVNLLPREFSDASRVRRVQASLAAGVLAAVALVALTAAVTAPQVTRAEEDLAVVRQQNAAAAQELAQLQPVRDLYSQVEGTEAIDTAATTGEVDWMSLLDRLSTAVPDGVWVETMSVTRSDPATASGSVATISYTGRGRSHDDVATWLDVLAAQPGLRQPSFTTSTVDTSLAEPTVTFSSTVDVTTEASTPTGEQR